MTADPTTSNEKSSCENSIQYLDDKAKESPCLCCCAGGESYLWALISLPPVNYDEVTRRMKTNKRK
jgi:hypothetical protein